MIKGINKMDKITSVVRNNTVEQSYFSLIFGYRPSKNCFDFNMTEELYLKFLRFIKNHSKWDLVSKENIKVFYYYDLKLVVKVNAELRLEKDILLQYYDFLDKDDKGIRLMNLKKLDNMDLSIFPGLDEINDIRKVREIIFQKNNVFIKFSVVNHVNKEITFESIIYCKSNHKDSFIQELPKLMEFFNLNDLTKFDVKEFDNLDKLSLSVL